MVTQTIQGYFQSMARALEAVAPDSVDRATQALLDAYNRDATIFVIGNGGSATTASHFALDISKNAQPSGGTRRVRCIALTDNVAALTAWGNDNGYETIFEQQLVPLWRDGDLLVVISASGNSSNVVRAVQWVNERGGVTVGLLGMAGGVCAGLCAYPVVIPDRDYGIIENGHLAVTHYWVDVFKALP